MPHPFDAETLFGDDYLYFYAAMLGDERSDADTEAALSISGLDAGMSVLDAPCGHGRLSVRMAQRGLHVTGVDVTAPFVDLARAEAAARGVDVALHVGDVRHLPVDGPFDGVVCWFTSFGFYDDLQNVAVLREYRRVLAPGGVLVLDTLSHDGYVRTFTEAPEAIVVEVDGNLMVDRNRFDVDEGCVVCHRVILRDGQRREARFFIRLPTLPEWRTWLSEAGFGDVTFSDTDGGPVDLDTWRIVVRAVA